MTTTTKAVVEQCSGDGGWHQIDVFHGKRDRMLATKNLPWFGQFKQDKIAHKLLGNLKGGCFVDLAAGPNAQQRDAHESL